MYTTVLSPSNSSIKVYSFGKPYFHKVNGKMVAREMFYLERIDKDGNILAVRFKPKEVAELLLKPSKTQVAEWQLAPQHRYTHYFVDGKICEWEKLNEEEQEMQEPILEALKNAS